MNDDDPDLGRLAQVAGRRSRVEDEVAQAVRGARSSGATWAQIGAALGVTAQGAHQRYGPRRQRVGQ